MDDPRPPVPLERLLLHRDWVRRVAFALVADAAAAEDLEQEVWLRALTDRPRSEASARGWLRTVLRRTASNMRRGRERRRGQEEAAAAPECAAASPGDLVAEAETARRVLGAVMDLAEPYRATVLLRYYEDLPTGSIAARQGVPVETARTRLKRAHAMLRDRLDAEERGDRRRWMALLLPLARRGSHGPPIAAAGGSSLAAAAGVLAMTIKAKVGIAAAVVGLAGIGWWALAGGNPRDVQEPVRTATPTGEAATAPVPGAVDPLASAKAVSGSRSLAVRVVDLADRPVAGAIVLLHPDASREGVPADGLTPGPTPEPHAERSAVVDGAGAAVLSDLPEGSWHLRARAEAFADALASASTDRPGVQEPVTLVLRRALSLEGTVRDGSGEPLVGVEVRIQDALWSPSTGLRMPSARTREDGGYRVDGIPPGHHEVRVALPSGVVHQAGGVVLPGPARYDVILDLSTALHGVVRDAATGEPVEGARVKAWIVGDSALNYFVHAVGVSDADGLYRIPDLPPGRLSGLSARCEGFVDFAADMNTTEKRPPLRPGSPLQYDLSLDRGVEVRGVIRDPSGRPIEGASVQLLAEGKESGSGPRTRSAADGTYRHRAPGGSRRLLLASHEGYYDPEVPTLPSQALAAGEAPERLLLDLPASGAVLRDLVLLPGRPVEGRVVDPEGHPVAGATVSAYLYWYGGSSGPTVSGKDGTFRIEAVRPGRGVKVMASLPGNRAGTSEPFDLDPQGPVPRVEVVLRDRGAVFSGRIVGPEGEPVQGASLRLVHGRPADRPWWYWDEGTARTFVHPVRPDGSFRIVQERAGTWTLLAEAPGCAPSRGPTIALEEGETREGVEVRLSRESRIEGVVRDEEGAPVEGVALVVREGRGGLTVLDAVRAVTEASGRFSVGGLAAVPYRVVASKAGFAGARTEAFGGTADLLVTLRRPLSIAGVVRDFDSGLPVPGVPVAAARHEPGNLSFGSTWTDGAGRFRIERLKDGPHEITVGETANAADTEFLLETLPAVDAGTLDLEVGIHRGLSIAGGLVDGDGNAVGVGMSVYARPRGPGGTGRNAESRADGTFRVGGLEPGTYDLIVSPRPNGGDWFLGGVYAHAEVPAIPAGKEDLVVRLQRGKPIAGRVVDERGDPIRGSHLLRLEPRPPAPEGEEPVSVMTDDLGSFRSPALREDRLWDVVAAPWSLGGTLGGRVDGVRPGTRDVVLVARRGGIVRGQVLTMEGKPVPPGVPVTTVAPGKGPRGEGMRIATATGIDGSFTLGGLGEDNVVVTAGGIGSAFAAAVSPPVRPGGDPVEIRVAPGATLSGRLVDAAGARVVPDLLVAMQETPVRFSGNATVASEGSFDVRGLAPGTVRLVAYFREASSYRVQELGTFPVPAADLVVEVPAQGR